MTKPKSCRKCVFYEFNEMSDEQYCNHEKSECEYLNYYLDAHRHKPKECPLNVEAST